MRYSVAYDPEAMRLVLLELLDGSGARLLLHAQAAEPVIEAGRISAVAFQSKAGRFAVRAKTVIDATGDGDLFAAAGCAHEREDVLPWLWFVLGGVEDAPAAAARGVGFRTPGAGPAAAALGRHRQDRAPHRRHARPRTSPTPSSSAGSA